MDNQRDLFLFTPKNNQLFVTELGHSRASFSKEAPPQVRSAYILHIIIKGTGHFAGIELNAGDAFLLSKKVLHSFSFDADFEDVWIGFNGDDAENLLNAFNIPTHKHMHFKMNCHEKFQVFLQTLLPHWDAPINEQQVLSLLLFCLPYLKPYKKEALLPYVEQAKKFIDNNYQYRITIDSVAKNVNLSDKYLCKLFKRTLGLSPQQYLIETRMKMARKLLVTTNISIKAVAENVGYPSQFAFSTAYKKYYKISPSAQRRIKEMNQK